MIFHNSINNIGVFKLLSTCIDNSNSILCLILMIIYTFISHGNYSVLNNVDENFEGCSFKKNLSRGYTPLVPKSCRMFSTSFSYYINKWQLDVILII